MKRFLPGTLNPLYEADSPYDIDTEELNNSYYMHEMEKKILQSKLEQDLFAGMKSPKAILLGPSKFSFNNTATDYATPVHAGTKPSKGNFHTWYHFRIPEIHSHLPDPCDPRLLKDKAAAQAAMYDHPIAPYIQPDLNITPTNILPGSIVEIQYDRGPHVGMQLFPKIVKVMGPSYGVFNIDADCRTLLNTFAESVGYDTVGSGPVGDTSTARSEYPPCDESTHGIKKQWTKRTIKEYAEIVKKQVSNKNLAISIIAVAIQEQGSGNSVTGYNYNRYGIMTDLKGGWGTGKIKCSVSSTEGASGSGDRREKNRWFAAFETEEDGISFMASQLSTRGFNDASTSEDWVALHIDKWLSPSDKDTRIKSKDTKWVNYRNKKAQHWTKAESLYGAPEKEEV